MVNERNALAELAVRLGTDALSLGADKYPEIEKAQRIVAELAKVPFFQTKNGTKYVRLAESAVALENCRAIAEEGADNGK